MKRRPLHHRASEYRMTSADWVVEARRGRMEVERERKTVELNYSFKVEFDMFFHKP